jgi:hypothetical protein
VALCSKFLMVELKVVSKGLQVRLSPHQIAFHLKHAMLGCPTFIVVEYHPPPNASKKPQILVYEGKTAKDICTYGVKAKTALTADLSPQCWNDVFDLFSAAVQKQTGP